MEVHRRVVYSFALLLAVFAVSTQPCHATAITLDMSHIDWHFDSTTETFDLSAASAKGNLTFALNQNTGYIQSVPTAYTAVENALTINVTDRSGWALLDIRADFHFDGGILNVDVSTVQVKSMELAGRNPQTVNALQFYYPNMANAPNTDYASAWGGAGNVSALTSQYHFTFASNAALFAPTINIPTSFLFPTPVDNPSGPSFTPFDDPLDGPEPASILLVGTGLGSVIWFVKRRRSQAVVKAV